jgi:hypothetical protein
LAKPLRGLWVPIDLVLALWIFLAENRGVVNGRVFGHLSRAIQCRSRKNADRYEHGADTIPLISMKETPGASSLCSEGKSTQSGFTMLSIVGVQGTTIV